MRVYPDVSQSMATYARAGELIPGWTQLISRRADQFANGVSPVYAQRAKGSRFIDVDENEYIDWVNAVGAVILGHADDVVDDAVIRQIEQGSITTLNSRWKSNWPKELARRSGTGDGALPPRWRQACA
ncbi:MAG: aminotransferase class III-fold pyridoxal phosphate-dependent enzyme [Caldilineaceae bacterium]